jgi:hypothetical protein
MHRHRRLSAGRQGSVVTVRYMRSRPQDCCKKDSTTLLAAKRITSQEQERQKIAGFLASLRKSYIFCLCIPEEAQSIVDKSGVCLILNTETVDYWAR